VADRECDVRVLRGLWNAATVSLLAGIAGGLLLGWILSRGGNGWLTPLPWIVYFVALIAFATVLSLVWPADRPERAAAPRESAVAGESTGSGG
jgi:hypothetical protein